MVFAHRPSALLHVLLAAGSLAACISPGSFPAPDLCVCADAADQPLPLPAAAHVIPCVGCVNAITSPQQLDHILAMTDGPVVVSFTQEGCEPCIALQPLLGDFALRRAGDVTVLQVDVERSPALGRRHGIEAVPTLRLWLDGKEIRCVVGLRECQRLDALVDAL